MAYSRARSNHTATWNSGSRGRFLDPLDSSVLRAHVVIENIGTVRRCPTVHAQTREHRRLSENKLYIRVSLVTHFEDELRVRALRLYIVVRPCLGNMKIKATIRGRIGLLEQEIKA